MWLVLCLEADAAALWAHAELERQGLKPLELVTDRDLAGATWDHRVDGSGVRTRVTLADGRSIDSDRVTGALNRFFALPPRLLADVEPADFEYAAGEMSALVVSWLAGLGRRAINPSGTRGLAGAWRSSAEWAALAAEAGMPASPVVIGEEPRYAPDGWHAWPPLAMVPEDVIVVGRAVFARRRLGERLRLACHRLAELSETPLLGLRFATDVRGNGRRYGGRRLAAVTPLPDLRAGGHDLVVALADELRAVAAP